MIANGIHEGLSFEQYAAIPALSRTEFIGGSDAAAVLGISPWKTPYQLYLEKTGALVEMPSPQQEKTWARGKRLEPYAIEWARQDFELDITAKNARYSMTLAPYLSCEIDFEWLDEDGSTQNADIKTVHPRAARDWGEPGTDQIPDYYTAQFLFGLGITGRQRTLCIALIGVEDLRPYRIERDNEVVEHILRKCTEFWRGNVLALVPPPITSLDDARLAWKKETGKEVVATPEIAEMVERIRLLNKSIGGDRAKIELLELEVKKRMADAPELISPGGSKLATWKTQARKAYSVPASECRVFRVFEEK